MKDRHLCRYAGKADVTTSGEPPVEPDFLSKGARAVWRDVVPGMFARGLCDSLDAMVLSLYCEAVSNYLIALRRRKNRDEKEILAWLDRSIRLARELGLTPASRSSLVIPTKTADESLLDKLVS